MSKKRAFAGGSLALILALVFGALVAPTALAQDTSALASCDPTIQALVWAARDAYGYDVSGAMMAPMGTTGTDTTATDDSDDSDDGEDAEPTPEATEAAKLTNVAKVPTGIQQDATEEPTEEPSDDGDDEEDSDSDDAAAAPAPAVNCDAIRADVVAFVYAANNMTMGGDTGMTGAATFMVDGQTITPNFHVLLSGPQEVPGPGDDDAVGEAWVSVDGTTNMVCWSIAVTGMNLPAAAAHIHTGAEGESGPPVVDLTPPSLEGVSAGCTAADPAVVQAILANPTGHYVNIHNADFPDGATRGQLLGV